MLQLTYRWIFLLFLSLCTFGGCQKVQEDQKNTSEADTLNYPLKVVSEDPAVAMQRAKDIKKNTAVILADGLQISLWATDSLAPDPIAMSITDDGKIYLTRTNRQKDSEFDIRGHRDWMTPSIGFQSIEDRRKFLHKIFAPENSAENDWMKDLNGDGVKDWHDLTVEEEEVWRLEDRSGDGMADISTRVVRDFHNEITDVAGALLVRDSDMFIGVGPDMWRLKDEDGDGTWDKKTSISHGFNVHIGFGGHGMSGARQGPDGKIYWGIGDVGVNITTDDGTNYKYPNQGVIVRCNPDGSDFEVFAHGLRNTHEFVFDQYGNVISSDNDGDHAGESERLVYIIDGHDAGWRSNWQYGKYTDPKNNGYNVWMDEKLFVPHWDGQAAYMIPPIVNYHNGPAGMAFNPGTALGKDWLNTFFLVEFVGTPSRSHIWSFQLKPKGASFELAKETDMLSGILPTGIGFGPDGALYLADWINGWNTKNYGRVWKLDVADDKNDLADDRKETERLMQLHYRDQTLDELKTLLSYKDMRIRQKAQFELVTRDSGLAVLSGVARESDNQLARIHAIWGIGQLIRQEKNSGEILVDLLQDDDPEIISQAEKVIGDEDVKGAEKTLTSLLSNDNARVKFFAAQALGKINYPEAVEPLLKMIKKNNDQDIYLRYAGVLALSKIGKAEQFAALKDDPSHALRLAAVLVLRKLQSPKVGLFLKDKDEYIVTEAARAINDDWSIEPALPELAAVLSDKRFTSGPLIRRAINAALRVGGDKEMDLLIQYAVSETSSPVLRAEALAALSTWANPSLTDRVDGRYRGEVKRNPEPLKQKLAPHIAELLTIQQPEVLKAVVMMMGNLSFREHNEQIIDILNHNSNAEIRSAALSTLNQLEYPDMESVIKTGMNDSDEIVRTTALGMLGDLEISKENLPAIVDPIFDNGSLREQQQVISVLKNFSPEKTEPVLADLMMRLEAGKIPDGVKLELFEAIDSTHSDVLTRKLADYRKSASTENDAYQETLFGGNGYDGYQYFMNNSTGQCARCHAIHGQGGQVGPDLTTIGDVLPREKILEALIHPSARLSPGYGTVSLTLTDGSTVTGTLMEENDDKLILKTSQAEPMEVPLARISKRQNLPSGMPPMGDIMSKREIRNMIEFLSNMKKGR